VSAWSWPDVERERAPTPARAPEAAELVVDLAGVLSRALDVMERMLTLYERRTTVLALRRVKRKIVVPQ
jgi:hypothetical protein